jgi:AcrR family transcriptional regulator
VRGARHAYSNAITRGYDWGMDTRQRILAVTADLLQRSSVEPVSTREICKAAGVTAPTLYHHFGDKEALYDAVVAREFESHLEAKHARTASDDPVADLYRVWDAHVAFGVSHPGLYALMYGSARPGSSAAEEAHALLADLLGRVAKTGRLDVGVDQAGAVIEAACVGMTLQAIHGAHSVTLSDRLRDAVFDSVLTGVDAPPLETSVAGAATQLFALLSTAETDDERLTPEELSLLRQWLRRLS